MSGLAALLDDVAAIAKMTAASVDDIAAASARASAKAAGVVVDDAAVTPQYVEGVNPTRELPIIKKIAMGSLRNKLAIILPWALLLSEFAPFLLTPLLMLGGTYLCFEGAEKIWSKISGHHKETPAVDKGPGAEDKLVKGAITTDFILSCEIMVISLNEVATEPIFNRAAILAVVALGITALVYGAVGLIVKMDDIGLSLAQRESPGAQKVGRGLVLAMPKVMTVISVVGVFAMLWVGGHIILVGLDEIGLSAPYEFVHHAEGIFANVPVAGGALAWLTNTFFSLILGLVWGGVIVAVVELVGRMRGAHHGEGSEAEANAAQPMDDGPAHGDPSD